MFLNRNTGELTFADGFRLHAGMRADALGVDPDEPTALLEAREAHGALFAPLCELEDGELRAVTLTPLARGTARQRSALFAALRLRDPCPDTRLCVRAGCPFGEVLISTEPYFGRASARVEYRAPKA